ncbi:hypothetical protein JOD54_004187 [Actinokineospora baliensis]|uniref:DUF3558 family protein n=1 Tax=Actinokineospora baliensis TaxID=547056 RepID=UPI00195EE4BB|nr:DUF3558 family protein [Actinokineospora baliensis]MBM7773983.1 hypothetical protein [Actinokineospora baliensis]
MDTGERLQGQPGNPCEFSKLDTAPMVQICFGPPQGLDDLRAAHGQGRLSPNRWQIAEIDGSPAITYQREPGPGWCETAVELDDTHYINARIRYNDGSPTHDPCTQSKELAAAALATARSGR